ncbi:putative disease resistance protein RGA4 [Prunus yedoensis var. nudiflora]|uniref:Putative disease resistance protein RGA4 n=1 Tax=Prunus yedoensis var. nudiflora TaxID=2094558 RepID=A0A314UWG1_PRUYE|nr:putative disease resistance protein RGA4 [Prunus yedoensis var. nudiflora]
MAQKDLSKEKEEDPEFLLSFEKLRTIIIPDLDRVAKRHGKPNQPQALPHWLQESANTLQGLRLDNTFLQLPDETILRKLKIIDCPNLVTFPKGMHCLTALRELEISSDPLAERCRREEGEDWYKIAHIPKIILYSRII